MELCNSLVRSSLFVVNFAAWCFMWFVLGGFAVARLLILHKLVCLLFALLFGVVFGVCFDNICMQILDSFVVLFHDFNSVLALASCVL